MHFSTQLVHCELVGQGHRAGDRSLQLLIFNEEFLVSTSQQLTLITSLPGGMCSSVLLLDYVTGTTRLAHWSFFMEDCSQIGYHCC